VIVSRLHLRLRELLGDRCEFDAPMAELTTWRVGGPADCLVRPQTKEEVAEILRACEAEHQPVRVVGAGSNLLILDGGVRGVTILMRQGFDRFAIEERPGGVSVTAGAALSMQDVVDRCAAAGVGGWEFIAGVPGSVGGAVRMNAGTKTGDIAGALAEIEVVDADGKIRRLPREKLAYRYRGLALEGVFVVTEAKFNLRRDDPPAARECVAEVRAARAAKQPLEWPSAGSTFKNPEGDHAARLIEAAGLKGLRIGGAQISEKHANFFLNVGDARAADILALIEHARQVVYQKFNVWLEPEVKIWGERDAPE
jgi:UDP-N-acetylmuramate dehydrogenase